MADAGLRIAVEGEKEFKAALASVDVAVKNNNKSLRLLTEEYNLNNQSAKDLASEQDVLAKQEEILATKGKVLADSIAQQTEKVDLLDLRVEEASKAYGEHDKRTEALRGQLLDASVALAKMTAEQEKNNQAVEANRTAQLDAQHSTAEYERAVEALSASVAANDAEIKRLTDAGKDLEKENASLGKSTDDMRQREENLTKANEKLTEKGERLRESIEKQRAITENLGKAHKEVAARYGEGSKESEAYRKKVADATAQLDRMESELKQTETAIRNNNKEIENGKNAPSGMIDGLEKVEELTGVKIPDGIKTMIGGFDGGSLAVGGIVTALGGVAAKMADIYADTVDWARDLTTNSQKLDLGTEEYQRLEHVAKKAGFPMSDLEKAIEKIGNKALESDSVLGEWIGRMDELKYASDDVKKAVADEMKYWDDLGVTLYDDNGEMKDTVELLFEMIGAMEKMETNTQKNQAAYEIFGKKFREVNTLIETGEATLREYYEEARVHSEEEIERLNKVGQKWSDLKEDVGYATKEMIIDVGELVTATGTLEDKLKHVGKNLLIGPLGNFVISAGKYIGDALGIGKYADGTDFHPGGLALVGERGPEIVQLPRGSAVYPHGTAPAGMSTANTYNITIDAKNIREFNDIIRYAQGARVAMRRG